MDSKTYIGTKIIDAELITKNQYESWKGVPQSSEDALGYKVTDEDGSISWLPKVIFEKSFRSCEGMSFGMAVENLRRGYKVGREGWNGKNMYLELQTPDENSKMSLPYIFMKTVQNDLVPWLASQTDMLSDDWFVYAPDPVNPADIGNTETGPTE